MNQFEPACRFGSIFGGVVGTAVGFELAGVVGVAIGFPAGVVLGYLAGVPFVLFQPSFWKQTEEDVGLVGEAPATGHSPDPLARHE